MNTLRLFCLATILIAAESKATAQEKMRESPWYPLEVGNTWTYRFGEGKLGDVRYTLKVTRHEKIGDVLCARVESTSDGKLNDVEHDSVAEDGIYRQAFNGQKFDKPVCVLKLDKGEPKKGETWKIDTKGPERSLTGEVTCDIVDEVKLASGASYKNVAVVTCKEFDANGLKGSFTYWFAKDVGMIKQEFQHGKSGKFMCELEKFEKEKK
jgi:hypothetical protein